MKIGKKIFLALILISLSVLAFSAVAGFFQIARLRTNIANVHYTQSEALVAANTEVLTDFNENMVTALAKIYSESLEDTFAAKINQMLTVRDHLQDAYAAGVHSFSRFDDRIINLREDVSFEDIEDEFLIIQSVRDLIANIQASDTEAWIYFSSESGIFIEYGFTDYHGRDFRTGEWYTGAVEAGGVYWTGVRTDARTGELEICIAVPVYGPQGQLMGVVGSDLLLVYLMDDVLQVDTDIFEFTFFLDAQGEFILGSELNRELADFVPDTAVKSALVSTMSGDIAKTGLFSDGETIVGFAETPSTGWRVGVLVDYQRISRPIMYINAAIDDFGNYFMAYMGDAMRAVATVFLGIAVIIIIFSVFVSRIVSGSITKPLEILTEGVGKISAGDLEYKIEFTDMKSGSEIQILADSFNAMTASLREYISDMVSMRMETERIATELNIATRIQASMLPSIFPAFPERDEFDIYAYMEPAKEVGGDFYDFFMVDENTLAVVVADVSGKGIPAALFMVITKTLIQNNAQAQKSPREVFETVNNILRKSNDEGMFVTAILGYLDIATGKFVFVNAGHNPPLLLDGTRSEWLKEKPNLIMAWKNNARYKEYEVTLNPGEVLFLYTDGVTEAMNPEKAQFGAPRLQETVNSNLGVSLKEFTSSVKNEIDAFAAEAEQADDITMLVLRYKGRGGFRMDELCIEAKLDHTAEVLNFVGERISGCPPKTQKQIKVAVDEIFSNIARYAYHLSSGGVTVRVSVSDVVMIEFEDSGTAYDPLTKDDPDVAKPLKERKIGGLGVFMVKKLMDSVEYRRDGDKNILTIRKSLG